MPVGIVYKIDEKSNLYLSGPVENGIILLITIFLTGVVTAHPEIKNFPMGQLAVCIQNLADWLMINFIILTAKS